MPLHTLGRPSATTAPNVVGITLGDVASIMCCTLYLAHPGVSPQDTWAWLVRHVCGGSNVLGMLLLPFAAQKVTEISGALLFSAVYQWERHHWPGSKYIAKCRVTVDVRGLGEHVREQDWQKSDTNSDRIASIHSARVAPWMQTDEAYDQRMSRTWRWIVWHQTVQATIQLFLLVISASCRVTKFNWAEGQLFPLRCEFSPLSIILAERVSASSIPPKHIVAFQVVLGWLISDICFYIAHRIMHRRALFTSVHGKHHEDKEITAYTQWYIGLIDQLVQDGSTAALPILIFQMHPWVSCVFGLPLFAHGMRVHSGLDSSRLFGFCPWNPIPFSSGTVAAHALHHKCGNVNFGTTYFVMDSIFGTYRNPVLLDCHSNISDEKEQKRIAATTGPTQVTATFPSRHRQNEGGAALLARKPHKAS